MLHLVLIFLVFSAATVHDMFNWLTVITLLPLEVASGYLYYLTSAIVASAGMEGGGSKTEFLSVITKPFTNFIVQVTLHNFLYRNPSET